jgi:hypothetical protein
MSNISETNKIDFVIGERDGFLEDILCDNYFFEDINTMNILLDKSFARRSTVYCPEYEFNMRTDLPYLVKSPKSVDILEKDHNISVNTIKLPF